MRVTIQSARLIRESKSEISALNNTMVQVTLPLINQWAQISSFLMKRHSPFSGDQSNADNHKIEVLRRLAAMGVSEVPGSFSVKYKGSTLHIGTVIILPVKEGDTTFQEALIPGNVFGFSRPKAFLPQGLTAQIYKMGPVLKKYSEQEKLERTIFMVTPVSDILDRIAKIAKPQGDVTAARSTADSISPEGDLSTAGMVLRPSKGKVMLDLSGRELTAVDYSVVAKTDIKDFEVSGEEFNITSIKEAKDGSLIISATWDEPFWLSPLLSLASTYPGFINKNTNLIPLNTVVRRGEGNYALRTKASVKGVNSAGSAFTMRFADWFKSSMANNKVRSFFFFQGPGGGAKVTFRKIK